jgi:hypothetical protein
MADIWAFIVQAVPGFIGALIALGVAILAKVPEKLLDYASARKLDSEKHEQDKKIEQLRTDLNRLSDRGTRSNEREYQAVIKAWEQFVDAYVAVHNSIASFTSRPPLETMSDDEIRQHLQGIQFSNPQIEQILHSADRPGMFWKVVRFRHVAAADTAVWEANAVIRKQGIFIPKGLEDQFVRALELVRGALVDQSLRVIHEIVSPDGSKATMEFSQSGQKVFDELKAAVRAQLMVTDGAPFSSSF